MNEKTYLLPEQRSVLYKKNIGNIFSAAILDVDGTLTPRGQKNIPVNLCEYLASLSEKIPMALCTGRDFKACLVYLDMIFEQAKNPALCRSNWYVCAENGCVGYFFDPEQQQYREWYNVEYPYGSEHFQNLFALVEKELQPLSGGGILRGNSMIFRAKDYTREDQKEVAKQSNMLYQKALPLIRANDPEHVLTVADTAIATIVFPAEGHKGRGILEFAKILQKYQGFDFQENFREILAVGDRPIPGGNDEAFLDGSYATPFTVGDIHGDHILPLPVYDSHSGEIVSGPEGTLSLLKQVRFR